VLDEYENHDADDIKLSTNKPLIKKEAPSTTQTNITGSANILIDLNNIFQTGYITSASQPPKQPLKTDINNLDSIFNTINFTNNPQPQPEPQNNQINNIFGSINLTGQTSSTQPVQPPTFNILDTLGTSNFSNTALSTPTPNTNTNSSVMKQTFKNNEITVYCSSNKSPDRISTNVTFYISNNINKSLNNVKLQFSVPKYMERTINSPSGNILNALASLGIQQVSVLDNV
jgi:hypothetical protein